MYVEIPAVEGSPTSRIAALQASRDLLMEEPSTSKTSIFGGESHNPGSVAGPAALIRLATYIETGHDYRDTHPSGKRRPVIKQIANVTIVAPEAPEEDELNHLLHHLFNGDFDQKPEDEEFEEGRREDSGIDEDTPGAADEEAHQPQAEGDRPRFA